MHSIDVAPSSLCPHSTKIFLVQRKNLQTDRVILQPGKRDEVEVARRIFHSFVVDRKSETAIALELNEQLILNQFGRPWQRNAVHRLLTNESGNYIYNRKSSKLKQRRTPNPQDVWVRCENALAGIIEPTVFDAAKRIINDRRRRTVHPWPSNGGILSRLRSLLEQRGRLTCKIIDEADGLPCSWLYSQRFGGMRRVYELVGWDPNACKWFEARRAASAVVAKLGADILAKIDSAGGSAAFDKVAGVLTINSALTVSIFVARCQRMRCGSLRWNIRRRVDPSSDLVLAVRMAEGNTNILDYYLVPTNEMPDGKIRFWKKARVKLDPYRFAGIDDLSDPIWLALLVKMSALTRQIVAVRDR
jgi:hypothetical protein